MASFVDKENKLLSKLVNVQTAVYKKVAEEVANDILLSDYKSLAATRKKLEKARANATKKNTLLNKQKAQNIDIILSVMDNRTSSKSSQGSRDTQKRQSSRHSSVKASPKKRKARKAPEPKAKAPPKQSVRLVDVRGDGNCFYRALFGAAKNHPTGDLSRRIYKLFHKDANNSDVDEETFIIGVRDGTATMIEHGIYDEINEEAKAYIRANTSYATNAGRRHALSTQLTFFEDMRQSVFAPADSRIMFENWMEESADEIQEAFTLKTFKQKYKKPSDDRKFYKDLAAIIRDPGVFASQSDIDVVKFVLSRAGVIVHPDTVKPKEFYPTKGDQTHFWLKKVGNHYKYWRLYNY